MPRQGQNSVLAALANNPYYLGPAGTNRYSPDFGAQVEQYLLAYQPQLAQQLANPNWQAPITPAATQQQQPSLAQRYLNAREAAGIVPPMVPAATAQAGVAQAPATPPNSEPGPITVSPPIAGTASGTPWIGGAEQKPPGLPPPAPMMPTPAAGNRYSVSGNPRFTAGGGVAPPAEGPVVTMGDAYRQARTQLQTPAPSPQRNATTPRSAPNVGRSFVPRPAPAERGTGQVLR